MLQARIVGGCTTPSGRPFFSMSGGVAACFSVTIGMLGWPCTSSSGLFQVSRYSFVDWGKAVPAMSSYFSAKP